MFPSDGLLEQISTDQKNNYKKTSAACDVEIVWQTINTYNHTSLDHKNNLQSDVYRGIHSSSQCLMIPYGSDGDVKRVSGE